MTTDPMRRLSTALAISLAAAVALASHPVGYAAPALIADVDVSRNRDLLNAKALVEQAEKLISEGRLEEAETMWRKVLAILERHLGQEHLYVADALHALAGLLSDQKKHSAAEPLYRRSLAIRENKLGSNHQAVAISLNNLALLLNDQGLYADAIPLYIKSLAIFEKALGPDDPNVASSLRNLAESHWSLGQYSAAEPLLRRSLAIREKNFGSNHPDVANSLANLAFLLMVQGRYEPAETLYQRSLAIREKILGPDHLNVADSLDKLVVVLDRQGRHGAAEQLLRRSLGIREKILGLDHPDVATSLNNLAVTLMSRGQYEAAEPLYRRSLAIRETILGLEHPDVANSLDNLASLLRYQRQYRAAEINTRRALAIFEKNLGSNHPTVATSLNNLSVLLFSQGQYAEAEPYSRRSLAILERIHGSDHPDVANSLNSLALLLSNQGQYGAAEPYYRRSLFIRERILGSDHPDVAINLINLAVFLMNQGQNKNAVLALQRSINIQLNWLYHELPLLPNQSRSAQLRHLGSAWQVSFGWIDRYPLAAQLALESRLNRQGILAEIEQRQAQLLNAPGIDRGKLEQLQLLTQQLASVSLPPDRRPAVREQRDRLQAELYRLIPDLQIQTVTPAAVAKALPADGVLVEFQRYHPFDGRKPRDQRWGDPQYIALLLKPNGSIASVPLGPAAAIDAKVHKGLSASAQDQSDADKFWAQLSDQVLRPLLPHLADSRQWFLSPDGELNRVPFAALPAPQQPSTPLAQAVQLRLLSTGRELVRLQQPAPSGNPAVVMANPSFDRSGSKTSGAAKPDATLTTAQRRSAELARSRWLPLPGTQQEGQQVASLLNTRLVSGPAATTTALQRQQGPQVLHIATHGFFVADQVAPPSDPLQVLQEQTPLLRALRGEDPQLRSGLVFAGANQPDLDPNDDGHLTAAEALTLRLKGTELVVLSACSTGQGDIRTGEGVYGLQRSLTVAGARSTLLSLWKVDDAATAEFMVRFYRRLKAGEGRADALAAVQAEFRSGSVRGPSGEDWSSPYFWAAWQLVGDWRPIRGL